MRDKMKKLLIFILSMIITILLIALGLSINSKNIILNIEKNTKKI